MYVHISHILLNLYAYYDIKANIMQNKIKFRLNPEARLMDQVKDVLRYHHYAYRTEVTYCQGILRYIQYHGGKTHPRNIKGSYRSF